MVYGGNCLGVPTIDYQTQYSYPNIRIKISKFVVYSSRVVQLPSGVIMSSIFDINPDISLRRPIQRCLHVCCLGRVHDIDWIFSNGTSPRSSRRISRDTRSVREYRVAAIVCPDRIVDADWVVGVERAVEPLRRNVRTG
jgi:hypothetical protein